MRRLDSNSVPVPRPSPDGLSGDGRGAPESSDGPVVLTEKLRRPEPAGLARPRLEAPLRDGVPGTRLDLVVGPPGSGKTTLLARVAATTAVPVAWYRMTADDTAEPTMLAHLARSLRGALHRPVADGDLGVLLADLQRFSDRPAMLLLDDVHEIAGTPAERALERFVALRPSGLRVVIGSRRQPDEVTLRLRLWGQLHEICGDDLRFRSWEVEDLFRTVLGSPLTPESAAALTRRTGGWAAGLQLFHLATRGRSGPDRQAAVGRLSGRSRLIRSYLVRHVIGDLPEDRRRFLVATSALGTLTGELCDGLLGITGSAGILDDLEQQQLFTSSDGDGRTFRYHEVLRAHLEWALVEEYGPDGARTWYTRSAHLLESAGLVAAAVRAHARAGNWGAVAALVQSRSADPGAPPTGIDLVLPPSVVQFDPWLSLTEARRRVREGALADAVRGFEQAEALLDEPAFRECCRRERAVAAMWVTAPDDPRSRPVHWSSAVRAATLRMPASERPATDAGDRLATGLIRLLGGDPTAAAGAVVPLADAPDPTLRLLGSLVGAVATAVGGGVADRPSDRPSDAAQAELGQIALEAEFAGLPWLERLSRGLAEALFVARGAPSWRAGACDGVLAESERVGDHWGAAVLRLALGAASRSADPPRAAVALADAADRFRRLAAPVPAVWCDVLRGGVLARIGDPGAGAVARGAVAAATTAALPRAAAAARSVLTVLDGRSPAGAAGSASMVVRCLGPFELRIDAAAVDLGELRPRARAVLRMLAAAGGSWIHQERLVDAFWPEAPLPVGLRRLQVALSSVRQVLERYGPPGTDWLPRREHTYRLTFLPGSRLDVRDFEEHLAAAHGPHARDVDLRIAARRQAVALYRGDLLPEDGAADHVVTERDRLRLAAAAAATALAVDLRAAGRPVEALAAAERSIRLEPLQDAAWVQAAELYEATGDATAALRVRLQHARVVADLLPVVP